MAKAVEEQKRGPPLNRETRTSAFSVVLALVLAPAGNRLTASCVTERRPKYLQCPAFGGVAVF